MQLKDKSSKVRLYYVLLNNGILIYLFNFHILQDNYPLKMNTQWTYWHNTNCLPVIVAYGRPGGAVTAGIVIGGGFGVVTETQ